MTKEQEAERAAAIAKFRELVEPGDTLYTILRHVSRSGMQRSISVVVIAISAAMVRSRNALGSLCQWGASLLQEAARRLLVCRDCGRSRYYGEPCK